jgi:phosphoglucomutase
MNYLEKYDFWLSQPQLDQELKNELLSMNDETIKESFFGDISFGTGGLRGILGAGTQRINIYTIRKATLGFARYLNKHETKNKVAISYDNRKYSKRFALEAAMVLAAQGISVYLFEELKPTPMLSFAVRYFKCTGGIMITASHNPKNYNGYKVYDKTGAQLNLNDADQVIEAIHQITNPFEIKTVHNELIQTIDASLDDIYLALVEKIKIHEETKTIKIVYSPLHGTGRHVIPKILTKHGYDLICYEPQMTEDPNFTAAKSSNPEEKEAYEPSIKLAKEIQADVVMITDPDADRLGIAVLHQGDYVLLSGNQTAAVELYYLLSEKKKLGILPKKGFVYTTNVTTEIINAIAKSYDMDLVTTLTGFKFIGEMAEKNQNIAPYMFGAEESYGSLISDFVRDKDAVQAVFLLAEIVNHLKHQKMTLIDYLETMYQRYGYYYEHTESLTMPGLKGLDKINQIMDHYRNHPPVLSRLNLIAFDDVLKQRRIEGNQIETLHLPSSNVLKYYYDDSTWLTFRPSGTEPKIKIYFGTKASTMDEAKNRVQQAKNAIELEIKSL